MASRHWAFGACTANQPTLLQPRSLSPLLTDKLVNSEMSMCATPLTRWRLFEGPFSLTGLHVGQTLWRDSRVRLTGEVL